jgi:DNA-binding MarR family transcriptional regulator
MPSLKAQAVEFTELIRALTESISEIPEMIDRVHELGLNRNHLRILHEIGSQGDQTMSDLARAIRLSDSSATILVDQLVKKDLALRNRSDEDRRVVRVGITAAGREVMEAQTRAFISFALGVLATLGDEERETYLSLHRKIVDSIKKSHQQPIKQ